MDRHLIAITYLEWLNWGARGCLRVAPERIVWTTEVTESEALTTSLNAAPDLDPADDAFLLATVTRAPALSEFRSGLDLPFKGTQFEALSERSHRLLNPTATRMHAELAIASLPLQDAWLQWKRYYRNRSTQLRADRLLDWVWDHSPSRLSKSDATQLLDAIDEFERMIADRTKSNPDYMQSISGSDAYAWFCMASYASDQGILDMSEDASWKDPVNKYINASRQRAAIDRCFYRTDDALFAAAISELARERERVWMPLALAIAKHHSERVSSGQNLDFRAFADDLARFIGSTGHETDFKKQNDGLSLAIMALARNLPDEAVLEITKDPLFRPGWLNDLLQTLPPVHTNEESQTNSPIESGNAPSERPLDQPELVSTEKDLVTDAVGEPRTESQGTDRNESDEPALTPASEPASEAPPTAKGKKKSTRTPRKSKNDPAAEPDLLTPVEPAKGHDDIPTKEAK
ncbi:hypothetical protein [Sphingomonas sp. S-NIH.Pt1_0416]|uniref:hypothetical protein n=1 Tax=Sphingomonas sp. S-NIH.Pt1_0416 TaxID=1920123 RepID=UPI000F7F61F0|nr:hypothetical protein [Sphingomonas sp. S-NIH.Pt1_0416]